MTSFGSSLQCLQTSRDDNNSSHRLCDSPGMREYVRPCIQLSPGAVWMTGGPICRRK
jgi:hypothetical protein